MTFGSDHYVPVMKVKRGEKKALSLIAPHLHTHMTPLLEIVARAGKTPTSVAAHLDRAFKDLAGSVSPYPRCFIDTREIAADGPSVAGAVFQRAAAEGITFTPVTGISRSADVAAALLNRQHGIALRLTRQEFEAGLVTSSLPSFMKLHGLAPEQTDLIVDLGAVDDFVVAGVIALTQVFMAAVPNHDRWRTLTVSACAFPKTMGVVDRHSHDFVERAEWIAWRDGLHAIQGSLSRLPTFSDCGIQYPTGVEDFDFTIMTVSASVRYTLPDHWLLFKGESTKLARPGVQFPALARKLVYAQLQPWFTGENHCIGCKSMKAAADGAPGLGSAEVWRRLGTIHHLTTAIEALASLSVP